MYTPRHAEGMALGEIGDSPMQVFTITLERLSTGEKAPSLLFRGETETAAREYVQSIIDRQPDASDLRVFSITARAA